MSTPRATARLQLHGGFTLLDACGLVPYYADLGVSHYYLSPVTRARPGSRHGYDVIDHSVVSPELGGEAALIQLAERLREYGMGLILDIVPNHMATHAGNAWWWDVLRHGPDSPHASWFDIDWQAPDPSLRGKVLAPFLPEACEAGLAGGNVRLVPDESGRALLIEAYGVCYPIAPGSLAGGGEPAQIIRAHDGRDPAGRRRMHALLERQHYRLADWRSAASAINWRRFFEINDLIGVCVEKPAVFDAVHALPLRLYAQGLIDGVRIDHVDGLADPAEYCRKLRGELACRSLQRPESLRGDEPWIVVEKILAPDENLDSQWQVDGSTGYDFMDQTAAVLHDGGGAAALTWQWHELTGDARDVQAYVRDARQQLLDRHFVAERHRLLRGVRRLARAGEGTRDWSRQAIGRALDDVLVSFPVYRSYIAEQALPGALWRDVIRRFQQLTPPLAAKSLEDTVFYRYGRLLSRNEVGSDPAVFAIPASNYHQKNAWRAGHAPQSMLATATHDHKRGEDARARLAVLSEVSGAWCEASGRWLSGPGGAWREAGPAQAAERYMLFQTMVGGWPLDLASDDEPGLRDFVRRLGHWQVKALREAKLSSGWFEPDLAYEQAALAFLDSLLPGQEHYGLLCDIALFAQRIAPAGAVNSLAQVLLRVTAPGVPDMYQGTEFWDFSLVDPDNRREVDFSARRAALTALEAGAQLPDLLAHWRTGGIKQAVLAWALNVRRAMPAVFTGGAYWALPSTGSRADHVVAFIRAGPDGLALVVAPRLCCSGVSRDRDLPVLDPAFWGDTAVCAPRRYAGMAWTNALGGAQLNCAADGRIRLADALAELPVALLVPD
ncbi:MAG: malto-oligosyltrehalose synthase [Pusillimonas sp.]